MTSAKKRRTDSIEACSEHMSALFDKFLSFFKVFPELALDLVAWGAGVNANQKICSR